MRDRVRFLAVATIGLLLVGSVATLAPVAAAEAPAPAPECGPPITLVSEADVPLKASGFSQNGLLMGDGVLWTLPSTYFNAPTFNPETGEYRVKFPWFRAKPGIIKITGKRVDGRGRFRAETPKPGEYPPTGFAPSGLIFSSDGCWRITARLRRSKFVFHMDVVSQAERCDRLSRQIYGETPIDPNGATLHVIRSIYAMECATAPPLTSITPR